MNAEDEAEAETEGGGKANGSKPRSITPSGNLHDLFAAYLKKNRPTEIDSDYVRNFLKKIHGSPGSYSYVLSQARKRGAIKKQAGTKGSNTKWAVTINDK